MDEARSNKGQGAGARTWRSTVSGLAGSIDRFTSGLGRRASDEIRDHPAETIAAAAACGVMLAIALLPRRRTKAATRPGDWNL
jgi:hypothetical protein